MPGLDRPALHPVGVEDRLEPVFALGAKVEVVLGQLAQQRPTVGVQTLLELGVLQPGGLGAVQKAHQFLEPPPAGGEGVPAADIAGGHDRGPRRWVRRACSVAIPASAARSSSARAAS